MVKGSHHSPLSRRRLSKSLSGKPWSSSRRTSYKLNMKAVCKTCPVCGNKFYGRPCDMHRKIYCSSLCSNLGISKALTGRHLSATCRVAIARGRTGKHLSLGAKNKLRVAHLGITRPGWHPWNYKEDRSSLVCKRDRYSLSNWRTQVFIRDNYTCQKCGKRGGKLNAHHVKPYAKFPLLRYKLSNGETLCVSCHKEVHRSKRRAKEEGIAIMEMSPGGLR